MEPEGSLPHSQQPATCPCTATDRSSHICVVICVEFSFWNFIIVYYLHPWHRLTEVFEIVSILMCTVNRMQVFSETLAVISRCAGYYFRCLVPRPHMVEEKTQKNGETLFCWYVLLYVCRIGHRYRSLSVETDVNELQGSNLRGASKLNEFVVLWLIRRVRKIAKNDC